MNSAERRQLIESRLRAAEAPVSATVLANELHVSRQVIVGDVALLRAAGAEIQATPRGYVLADGRTGVTGVLACVHSREAMVDELNIMVDNGCQVLDVIVEHPVYGQLTGQLQLRSRYDVGEFWKKAADAAPLSALTGGIHLHTVRCPDEETLARVTAALRDAGFLLND